MAGKSPLLTPVAFSPSSKYLAPCLSHSRVSFLNVTQSLTTSRVKLLRLDGSVIAGCGPTHLETSPDYQVIGHGDGEASSGARHPGSEILDENESGAIKSNDSTVPHVGVSIKGFGRLKAQKVKAIITKTSQLNFKTNGGKEELSIKNGVSVESFGSYSKSEDIGRKKKVHAIGDGQRVPKALGSQEFGGSDQIKGIRKSMKHSHPSPAKGPGLEPVSDFQTEFNKQSKYDANGSELSVNVGSASSFRGWGDVGSIESFKSESTDILKQRWKLSSGSDFFSRKSFKNLGCHDYMIAYFEKQLFPRPSHIQAMAFEPILKGKSCIIADQSGSGKTFAYLAPIIQCLREEELRGLGKSSAEGPRVIVIVPTAELASQVLRNCRSVSKFGIPFRSMAVTGGFRQRTQLENLREGVDVLIATPGRFLYLIKEGYLQLSNLGRAVLDEIDILCSDEQFEEALQSLINSSPISTQYLFVTATLPTEIYNKLVELLPDCEVLMGPGMHRISSRLEEFLVDCSGDEEVESSPDSAFLNKKNALLELAERSPVSKTIVFCNKIETCRKVENSLTRLDKKGTRVQVLPFHAALAQDIRLTNMEVFMSPRSERVSQFLVCTDRASRGIDFANVDHVVLFDFPRDPSEYVRRVGRTARGAGGKGKAFIFAVGKQVTLARKVIDRSRKGHPLHNVPLAY